MRIHVWGATQLGWLLTVLSEIDDLLKGFNHASEESSIWESVSEFLPEKGVKAYIYHSFPAIGATDYESSFSYLENLTSQSERSCVVINAGFQKLLRETTRSLETPKFWCEWAALKTENQSVDDNLSNPQFSETLKGVSIPVHGPRWRNGCFSIEFSDLSFKCQNIDIQTLQWVCQSAHQNLCRLFTDQKTDLPQLTAREKQILTWIALGKSNADIAEILGISFHTVGTYTRRVFVKTNTNNRTSAALFGISNGLINV